MYYADKPSCISGEITPDYLALKVSRQVCLL